MPSQSMTHTDQCMVILWHNRYDLISVFTGYCPPTKNWSGDWPFLVFPDQQLSFLGSFAQTGCNDSDSADNGNRRMSKIVLIKRKQVDIVAIDLTKHVMSFWQQIVRHPQLVWDINIKSHNLIDKPLTERKRRGQSHKAC